jgi:mannose PTS system EIIA component
MTAIILVCHAPLGQALHAVACHAYGRYISDVLVADISANSSLDDGIALIETLWAREGRPNSVMLLTDLLGATPANCACAWMSLHKDIHVRGISGVSVPMMLKAMTYHDLSASELREKLEDCIAPNCADLERPA